MWDLWWREWHWDRFFSQFFGIIPPMLHTHLQLYVFFISSTTGRSLGSCSALWVLWNNGRKSALTLAFNQTAVKKLVLLKNKATARGGGGGGAPPPGFVACRLGHCASWTVTLAWIRSRYDGRAWTEFRVGTGGGPLWARWRTLGFHKMLQISWQAEELLASPAGLWCMELLIIIENLIIIAMRCCEVQACSCLLPACRQLICHLLNTSACLPLVLLHAWQLCRRSCGASLQACTVRSAVYCGLFTSELFNRLKPSGYYMNHCV